MYINAYFDVIVQDMDQPAFAYPLSPSPPPPPPKNFLHTVDVKLGISTLYQGSCIEELDKLETIPLRVLVSYAYLVFSHLPRVYMRLCKHGNHFTFLHCFFSERKRAVFFKSCDLICTRSGQYPPVRPAHSGRYPIRCVLSRLVRQAAFISKCFLQDV